MKLVDYTLFTNKLNHSTLWINYTTDEGETLDAEIPIVTIIDLLVDAREILDYDKEDVQMVILPDNKHISNAPYTTLHSTRILMSTTRFWNSYIYKERAIDLYLETIK